jgi:hypothetical protein
MGHGVEFKGVNTVLAAPQGAENVEPLHVFRNGECCVSCWQLSEAEVAEVSKTGRVFLSVFMGNTQPPVFIGGEEETRGLLADYGVWKR